MPTDNLPPADELFAVQCSVEGCDRPHLARGYCNMHYQRWRKHGSPTGGKTAFRGAAAAFIETALNHQTDDCLLWPYGRSHDYEVLKFNGIKREAHNLVCELAHGTKPSSEYEVAHSCNVSLCVNPKHLRWDTHAGNLKDSAGEAHGSAILTAKQVQMIRSEKQLSTTHLSHELGVPYATIYAIRTRRTWRHLP